MGEVKELIKYNPMFYPCRDLEFICIYGLWLVLGDGNRGRGSHRKSFSIDTWLKHIHRMLFGYAGSFTQDSVDVISSLVKKTLLSYKQYVSENDSDFIFRDKSSQRKMKQRVYTDLVKLHDGLQVRRNMN